MGEIEEVKRRLNHIFLVCAAMLLTALVAVLLSMSALYSNRGEFDTLTRSNYELARRGNRLRAEKGLAQARFMALKGEMRKIGKEDVAIAIQGALDRYASAMFRGGAADEKTQEDAQREGCELLASSALGPCVP